MNCDSFFGVCKYFHCRKYKDLKCYLLGPTKTRCGNSQLESATWNTQNRTWAEWEIHFWLWQCSAGKANKWGKHWRHVSIQHIFWGKLMDNWMPILSTIDKIRKRKMTIKKFRVVIPRSYLLLNTDSQALSCL